MGKRGKGKKKTERTSGQSGGQQGSDPPNDGAVPSGSAQPNGSGGSNHEAVDKTSWRDRYQRDCLERTRYVFSRTKGVDIREDTLKVTTIQERPEVFQLEFVYSVFCPTGWIKILLGPEEPKFTKIISNPDAYEKEYPNDSIYYIYQEVFEGVDLKLKQEFKIGEKCDLFTFGPDMKYILALHAVGDDGAIVKLIAIVDMDMDNTYSNVVVEDHRMARGRESIIFSTKYGPYKGADDDGGITNNMWYNKELQLGKGKGETKVYDGHCNSRPAAIKRVPLEKSKVELGEINILFQTNHRNVVHCYGFEEDAKYRYIALEKCDCNLQNFIHKEKFENLVGETYEEELNVYSLSPTLMKLMRGVGKGVGYIHTKNIIHRNLTPSNILIAKELKKISVKIADFAMSKMMSSEESLTRTGSGGIGTTGWKAPEVLKGVKITQKADMFNLGCLFFFCITRGAHPFGDDSETQQRNIDINNIHNMFIISDVHEAKDLISRLLDNEPEKRPDVATTLSHPLFWDAEKRIRFFHDVSDWEQKVTGRNSVFHKSLAKHICYLGWDAKVNTDIVDDYKSFYARNTNGKQVNFTVFSLLRCIRNLNSHFPTRPAAVKQWMLGPREFEAHFRGLYPSLLMDVYNSLNDSRNKHQQVEDLAKYFEPKDI